MKKNENELPHYHVYTRIAPSKINGVGVIAIQHIPKDTLIFYGDTESQTVDVDLKEVQHLPPKIKQLYDDFAVLKEGIYTCPINFNLLTIAWYLNCSKTPNVYCDANLDFFALRDIEEGEELTVDYSEFSEGNYSFCK